MDRPNETIEKDNELADFTDRLLDGKIDRSASTSDEDLLRLERTILRLTDAFPKETLEEAQSKQMLVRLKARMRREEEEKAANPSIWKRLFDLQSNPQMGLLFAVAAVVVLALVVFPSVQPPGSAVTGTALSGAGLFTTAGLVIGILVIFYWISRRK